MARVVRLADAEAMRCIDLISLRRIDCFRRRSRARGPAGEIARSAGPTAGDSRDRRPEGASCATCQVYRRQTLGAAGQGRGGNREITRSSCTFCPNGRGSYVGFVTLGGDSSSLSTFEGTSAKAPNPKAMNVRERQNTQRSMDRLVSQRLLYSYAKIVETWRLASMIVVVVLPLRRPSRGANQSSCTSHHCPFCGS